MKVGRPKTTHCKRNHPRVPGERSCIACRRHRERLKYRFNADFRERKKLYQRRWRRNFRETHGFYPSMLDAR